MSGQRSTRPRRNDSSELAPVSIHSMDMPARLAASLTASTASPAKPRSVRIWTGGTLSKPIRSVCRGIAGIRVVEYQIPKRTTVLPEAGSWRRVSADAGSPAVSQPLPSPGSLELE